MQVAAALDCLMTRYIYQLLFRATESLVQIHVISDILFDMVEALDRYLNDPRYDAMYCGVLRERIIQIRDDAEYIRFVLDTPYPEWHLPEGFVREGIVRERLEAREQAENEPMNDAG